MALVLSDRVQETTNTTGTGALTLAGATPGYQSFLTGIGNGNTTYYTITNGTAWETGIGTYSSTGPTLTRTLVLTSSNSNAAISVTAGSVVFCTYPASKAVYKDANGTVDFAPSTTSAAPINLASGVTPTTPNSGDVWSDVTGLYYKNNYGSIEQLDVGADTPGTVTLPTITVTGSGATINVSSVDATLFSQTGWQGDYKQYTIPAATGLALTDQSANYLVVNYNAGSPVYQVTTNVTTIDNSSIVGAALLWRAGTQVHFQPINWGLSTASRLNRRLVQTNRYQWASGLALGESTGNVITLTAGVIWYGVTQYNELAVTSASSNADFYYHVAGVWTTNTISAYNITQYDDGTNLQTLSAGRYAVNWVYRYLDGSGLPKLAYVLGNTNATLAQAVASLSPTPPPILSTMAILVGRIIVLKNAATATEIDSAFTQVFSGTTVTNHNDLSNIQGGTSNEEYHLTSAEYTGTGTGVFVRTTSPTLVTPSLGTPSTLVGTNITGTATAFNINGTVGATTPSTGKFTQAYSPNLTLTDAATIVWDTSTGQVATFTFVSTSRTVGAPTNLQNGAFYALAVIQNGGSNTLTWNSVFKWTGGVAPTLSTAAGAKDYFTFRSDGTNLYEQGRSLGDA